MGVGRRVPVVALLAPEGAHADDVAVFPEQAEVAVHRAKAQIGVEGLQLGVDLFRGGVAVRGAEQLQNGLALFAVFSLDRGGSPLFNNTNYY